MIPIKSEKEINIMREGSKILAMIMDKIKKMVAPGITGNELNRAAEALISDYKAEPAFKGYAEAKNKKAKPFPAALCVSINNVVVHSIPSDYKFQNGDIVSLDLGVKYKGFYADMAVTMPVGEIDPEVNRLIKTTKKSLKIGLNKAKVGNTFGDIGNTIQRFVEYQGFNVVRSLCGHGIGTELHEEPQIFNFGKRRSGEEIKPGMVFCIEPMVAMGDAKLIQSPDGYGYETKDGSLTAHFEHTITITKNGTPQVLTKP